MIRIAICDDDVSFTNQLKSYIEQKSTQVQDHTIKVTVYHCGEDFLAAAESGDMFHIVFMDIEMESMNGITAGYLFRSISDCDDVVIIYISSHNTYSEDLLDIGNVRFVRKPYSEEKLDIAFERAVAQTLKYMEKAPQKFSYTVNKDNFSIASDTIVYLKNKKKVISLYTWNSENKSITYRDKFYSSMPEAVAQLPQLNFVQCERSHIVNLAYVEEVWNTAYTLIDKDKTQIPIGKTYRFEAREAYFRHRGGI